MITSWLLKAKTLPPRQLVAMHVRDNLMSRLKEGQARKLTVIEAPAGFGKTTLLAQWRESLAAEKTRVAWLTLDADDTEDRFVAYLAFALQQAGIDLSATGIFGGDLGGAPTGGLALHSIMSVVASDGRETCLILDDVEKIADPQTLRQLETLFLYAPDNFRIAIAMRTNPGLALAHMSLKGEVNHFDASSLRFTADEMSVYLGSVAPAQDLRSIMERAEGWPVALQILRVLSAQKRENGAAIERDHLPASVAESYLTEQLVRGLAPHQLAFLCDISHFDEVNPALADHARERTDSKQIFRELDFLSALIPALDSAEGTVRLHPMLREHFATLANADPLRCAAIHRRAADWFARSGSLSAALRHAMAARDRRLAASLIVRAGGVSIWIRQGMTEVLAADRHIDDGMIAEFPRLGLMHAIVLIKQSRLREARAQYEQVAAATKEFSRDPSGGDVATLRREGLFILSMLAIYGCLPLSESHLLTLDQGLHDPDADDVELAHHKTVLCVMYTQNARFDSAWRYGEEVVSHCHAVGSIYGANFIDFHLGSIAMARGDALEAVQLYEKGRRTSRRHFPHDFGLRLIGDVLTAELDLERNAIANVKRRLIRRIDGLHDAEAWYDIYAAAYSATAEIYALERGLGETLAFLDQAQTRAEHLRLTQLAPLLDALRVSALTLMGDPDRALRVAERSPANFSEAGLGNGDGAAWREVESLAVAWVRVLLRHGRHDEAAHAAERGINYARGRGIARMSLRLSVLDALCANATNDRPRAFDRIEEICREIARTGYVRAVLREGADLAPLLREAAREMRNDSTRQQALDLEELLTGHAEAALRTPVFSPRELDVLRQLNQGLQDKVIARRLGVSEHAVRFHLKNIYAKTRARGRLEAVVRARELGVLGRQTS